MGGPTMSLAFVPAIDLEVSYDEAARPQEITLVLGGHFRFPKPGQDGSRGGARLGIIPELAEGDGKGVLVVEVLPDSPAAKAGVRGGDLIVKWEGAAISSLPGLLRALAARKPGDKVRLTVRRGDRPVDLEVSLGGR